MNKGPSEPGGGQVYRDGGVWRLSVFVKYLAMRMTAEQYARA